VTRNGPDLRLVVNTAERRNQGHAVLTKRSGTHVRVLGGDILVSACDDGAVALGVVTGEARCGVGLTPQEARALAEALLKACGDAAPE
jgi:hypothetical protein